MISLKKEHCLYVMEQNSCSTDTWRSTQETKCDKKSKT